MPLTKVKAIRVEGCAEVYNVEYKMIDIYPAPCPQNSPLIVPMGKEQQRISDGTMVIKLFQFFIAWHIFMFIEEV